MKTNNIKKVGASGFVNMGPLRLRQPLPSNIITDADPFILLHHYGPYEINEMDNPFDLGPHPHRGFEPITFLIQGEQLHRDSLGNESVVKAGDVQWTTAGRGIVHAESPTKEFVKKGGFIEGIQLWLNLPSNKKMIPANYQHVQSRDFKTFETEDKLVCLKVITGEYKSLKGSIAAQTSVNAFMLDFKEGGIIDIPYSRSHKGLLYLTNGKVFVNNSVELEKDQDQMIQFENDGEGITIEAKEASQILFLSGEPLEEKVTSWGPYVMNTQTEILEAMRDYQMGKMGFLPA